MGQKANKTEAADKTANLRVSGQMDRLLPADFPADFELELECECVNTNCHETIMVTRAQYADVVRRGDSYMVRPGHVDAETESVERMHDHYWIIHKRGTRS
jgi:hypothetical protein